MSKFFIKGKIRAGRHDEPDCEIVFASHSDSSSHTTLNRRPRPSETPGTSAEGQTKKKDSYTQVPEYYFAQPSRTPPSANVSNASVIPGTSRPSTPRPTSRPTPTRSWRDIESNPFVDLSLRYQLRVPRPSNVPGMSHYRRVDVPRDPRSFFSCVSLAMTGSTTASDRIRDVTASFIYTKWSVGPVAHRVHWLKWLPLNRRKSLNPRYFYETGRYPNTPASVLEAIALSEVYMVKIIIMFSDRKVWDVFTPRYHVQTITLGCDYSSGRYMYYDYTYLLEDPTYDEGVYSV